MIDVDYNSPYSRIINIEAVIPTTAVMTSRIILMIMESWIVDLAMGFRPRASMLFAIDLEKVKNPKVKLSNTINPAAMNLITFPICFGSLTFSSSVVPRKPNNLPANLGLDNSVYSILTATEIVPDDTLPAGPSICGAPAPVKA